MWIEFRKWWIEFRKWSRVEHGQVVESEGIIEPSDLVVVGTLQRE